MELLKNIIKKCIEINILVYDRNSPDYVGEHLCDMVYTVYHNHFKKSSKIARYYVETEHSILYKYNGEKLINIDFEIIENLTQIYKDLDGSVIGSNDEYSTALTKIALFEMENGDFMLGCY